LEGEDAKTWWSDYWKIAEKEAEKTLKLVKRKWWQILLFDYLVCD